MERSLSKAVGIDLGTTNSAVAVMNTTDTDIVLHHPTRHTSTTPSCVWKDPRSGQLVVGRMAARRVGTRPEPIRSVKRLMGRQTTVRVTDEDMTPEQVSGHILAEMKRQIEGEVATWGSPSVSWIVERAVVTVPAYFDYPAISATHRAAELAGLEVLDLLHEPTAAASYHCWSTKTTDGTFLVYDFGGGTFDVSVVRATAGAFEVLGISGNNLLGGDNIDDGMARRIQGYLVEDGYAFDLDLEGDPDDRIRFGQLKFLAEGVKQALSTQDGVMFRDSGTLRDKDGAPVIIDRFVERAEFEEVAEPIVRRTIGYCHEALELARREAGITLSDVDHVVLAGGSTHIPLVRELVAKELCGPSGTRSDAPLYQKVDTVVALGAAIRAAATGGLATYDPNRSVRVTFRGTGTTGSTTARVAGRAEALREDVDLTGGHVRLTAGDHEDEALLGPGGTFAFTLVPVQPEAESLLTFEVLDRDGAVVMSTARGITHEGAPRPDGHETSPAKLAKSFLLEVNRAGRPYMKELLPALSPLPTSARFTFRHPGDTEKVLFPLYQRKRRIQVIEVDVPATVARGTEITFLVRVDGMAMITVEGTIGDARTFEARVVDPPEPTAPTADEVAKLVRRFTDAVQYLKPGERAVAQAKWDLAMQSLDAALARADDVQAVHEFEELEAILADMPETDAALEPPKVEFDELVAQCRELNTMVRQVAEGTHLQQDEAEVARSIDTQAKQGEAAYRARDQRGYAEAIRALDRTRAYLAGLYQRTPGGQDHRSESERTAEHARGVFASANDVLRLAEASERRDLQDEVIQIQRSLLALERGAENDPIGVRQQVSAHAQRLQRIRNLVAPKSGDGYVERLAEELL